MPRFSGAPLPVYSLLRGQRQVQPPQAILLMTFMTPKKPTNWVSKQKLTQLSCWTL